MQESVKDSRMICMRFNEDELKLLDQLKLKLSMDFGFAFDRTKTIKWAVDLANTLKETEYKK